MHHKTLCSRRAQTETEKDCKNARYTSGHHPKLTRSAHVKTRTCRPMVDDTVRSVRHVLQELRPRERTVGQIDLGTSCFSSLTFFNFGLSDGPLRDHRG